MTAHKFVKVTTGLLCVSVLSLALGCNQPDSPAGEAATAELSRSLVTESIYAASYGRIWRRGSLAPGSGDDWSHASMAPNVTAIAVHNNELYQTSSGYLWKTNLLGSSSALTVSGWVQVGEAHNVTGMASYNGHLYVASNGALWKRGAIGPGTGNDWSYAGDAFNVTAMTTHNGGLYVASNNRLWKRGAIGPGTGNAWSEQGIAYGVTSMASHGGNLFVTSNNTLWRRGLLGPGTGNDWVSIGAAANVAAMSSIPATTKLSTVSFLPVGTPLQDGDRIAIVGRMRFTGHWNEDPYSQWLRVNGVDLTEDLALLDPSGVFTVKIIPRVNGECLSGGFPTTPNCGTYPFQKVILIGSNGLYVDDIEKPSYSAMAAHRPSIQDARLLIFDPAQRGFFATTKRYGDLINNTWDHGTHGLRVHSLEFSSWYGPTSYRDHYMDSSMLTNSSILDIYLVQ